MAEFNIHEMKALSLKPRDLVVIRVENILRGPDFAKFRTQLLEVVPQGVKVVVLDFNTTWEVYRPVNAPPDGAHPEATVVGDPIEEPFLGSYRGIDIREMPVHELRQALVDLGRQLKAALAAHRLDVLPGEETPT